MALNSQRALQARSRCKRRVHLGNAHGDHVLGLQIALDEQVAVGLLHVAVQELHR
jgi:hypothetical protein